MGRNQTPKQKNKYDSLIDWFKNHKWWSVIIFAAFVIIAIAQFKDSVLSLFGSPEKTAKTENTSTNNQQSTNGNNVVVEKADNVDASNNKTVNNSEQHSTTINYITPAGKNTVNSSGYKTYTLNNRNEALMAGLKQRGYIFSNNNAAFTIELGSSGKIEPGTEKDLYFFKGGVLNVKVNTVEMQFPALTIPATFKYGNTYSYIVNHINRCVDSLVTANTSSILNEIIKNLK